MSHRSSTDSIVFQMKKDTAGADWFDLPAPRPHELLELYKQVEALRLRRAMDPKVHVKGDAGEKKGIKGLPKYFAVRTLPFFVMFATVLIVQSRLSYRTPIDRQSHRHTHPVQDSEHE